MITKRKLQRLIKEMQFHKDELPTIPVSLLDSDTKNEEDEAEEAEKQTKDDEIMSEKSKKIRVTKTQLEKFIRESVISEYQEMLSKNHIDGQAWSGTLEDLAKVQGKTWGHGKVADEKGHANNLKTAKNYTQGKAKSVFEAVQLRIKLKRIIRESYMKERYSDVQSIAVSEIQINPGLSGMELIKSIMTQYDDEIPLAKEEIFTVLDDLQEDGEVFFDTEEDAWYIAGSTEAGDAIQSSNLDAESEFINQGIQGREMSKKRR